MSTLASRISAVRLSPLFLASAVALLAAGMLFAGSAHAQSAPADAGWYCWVTAGHRPSVRCIQPTPASEADSAAADAWDLVRDASGAVDPVRVRQLVATNPAAFAENVTVIPLYLPPQDMDRVRMLLDAVMCYGAPECRIALL